MGCVRFASALQVREYERIVGDHPDVKGGGPALSIGWAFVESSCSLSTKRRKRKISPLNAETRRFLLTHVFDISKQEIKQADKVAAQVRQQRQETLEEYKDSLLIKYGNINLDNQDTTTATLPSTPEHTNNTSSSKQRQRRRRVGSTTKELISDMTSMSVMAKALQTSIRRPPKRETKLARSG